MNSRIKNSLIALFLLTFVGLTYSSAALAEESLWGLDGSGDLYLYDVESDTWTLVGNTGIDGNDAGLAYSPSAGLLYAIDENGILYSIDPSDASTTTIGDTGLTSTDGNYGAAFMAGALYVTETNNASLYTVDTSTAVPTLVASDIGSIEALAPGNDPNGPLYATSDNGNVQGTLTRDTGVFTPFPGEPSLEGDRGLGLAGGMLFGSDDSAFGSLDVTTGEIVVLADFDGDDLEALAGDGSMSIPALPVPTLPFYGLLLLTAFLGVLALRKL